MKKLLILVDTLDYAFSEIYQHQLHETLKSNVRCEYCTLQMIFNGKKYSKKNYFGAYCAIKARNTLKYVDKIKDSIGDMKVIIQDYDPWMNFIDDSPYKGYYNVMSKHLNVVSIFVASKIWSEKIKQSGIHSTFIKLGMLSRYCDDTKKWQERSRYLEFRGSEKKPRVKAMNDLINTGFPVMWPKNKIKPYENFLDYLSDLQIFAHSEKSPYIVDKKPVCSNIIWPKAIEVLSRGCFLIRDFQPESKYYDIDRLPAAFLFNEINEANDILDKINRMSNKEKNERIRQTVDFVRNQDYYGQIANQIIICLS